MEEEFFADDMCSGSECRFRIAIGDFQRIDEVRGQFPADQRRAGDSRSARIADDRQRLVFDVYPCRGVFGDIPVFRENQRDRLAHKGDFPVGQCMGPEMFARFSALTGFTNHAPFCEHGLQIA